MRIRQKTAVAALAAVAVLGATSVAAGQQTKTTKVRAALNPGQETPKPRGTKVGASGLFTGTLNGTTLTWRLTWKQLTGPATAAHIHMARRGKPGPVIVPLCGPCTTPATGTATLTTARNQAGEIRGQLTTTIPR